MKAEGTSGDKTGNAKPVCVVLFSFINSTLFYSVISAVVVCCCGLVITLCLWKTFTVDRFILDTCGCRWALRLGGISRCGISLFVSAFLS